MNLAPLIDHTLLKPQATAQDIETLCAEARAAGFAAVCVLPTRVALAARLLDGTDVAVCTVVGFPLGSNPTAVKAAETRAVIRDGATEVDMVIDVGAVRDGRWDDVRDDIEAVVDAAGDIPVKVILETALLDVPQKRQAAAMAVDAGAAFVKTSTGTVPDGGATVEDVALLRDVVGPKVGVKASGGVKTRAAAEAMVRAGATRIGTSAGLVLVAENAPALGSFGTRPRC